MRYPKAVPDQQITIQSLNNDVLYVIVDFVCAMEVTQHNYSNPKTSFDFREEGSTLFCLSLVSKRMRAVFVPQLFEKVFRYAYSMGGLNHRLRDIEGNPLLPSFPSVISAIK